MKAELNEESFQYFINILSPSIYNFNIFHLGILYIYFIFVCACVSSWECVGVPRSQKKASNPLDLELIDSCEPTNTAAGNQTCVSCKGKHS